MPHLMEAPNNYVDYKMTEGTSIKDHIHQMNRRSRNLIALGGDIDKEFQRLYMLQSLPLSWDDVCQTLSLWKMLTIEEIVVEFIVEL